MGRDRDVRELAKDAWSLHEDSGKSEHRRALRDPRPELHEHAACVGKVLEPQGLLYLHP